MFCSFFSITNLFLERVFNYLHGERGVSSSIPWFYLPMSPPAAARIERYFKKFVENGIQSFEAGAGSMAPASHLSIGSSPGCSASNPTRAHAAERGWPGVAAVAARGEPVDPLSCAVTLPLKLIF